MANPFIGEVSLFGFYFAPKSWSLCQGQLLPISQNQALYSLLGTQFGGDGRVSVGLPDLRGRTPLGITSYSQQGMLGGEEQVTVTTPEMPSHTHTVMASTEPAIRPAQTGNDYFATAANPMYGSNTSPTVGLSSKSVTLAGGNQPHYNMQPYLALNFCIALFGIYPSRN